MNATYRPSPEVALILDGAHWPGRKQQYDPEAVQRSMLEAQSELIRYYLPRMTPDAVARAARTLTWIRERLTTPPL